MKAMVFAAGMGSRLGKITETTPKCLVQVGGQTLLEHVIERLKAAGVGTVVINLFHLGSLIESYVRSKANFGITVEFSREEELLGTGGGLRFAQSYFSGETDFLIHNADIYSDLDLNTLRSAHRASGALATLATMSRNTDRGLLFDHEERLLGWQHLKEGKRTVVRDDSTAHALGFSGIQIVSPGIFNFMQDEVGAFSIIRAYMNAVHAGQEIRSFSMDGRYWIDAGTPERLEELRRHLAAM